MRVLVGRCFSTASKKYFMDTKYQNIEIETRDKFGSLSEISSIFRQNNVNLSFINSHFTNSFSTHKKYRLDMSIERQPEDKLHELQKKFSQIGINFKAKPPIQVPWFPREFQDLNLIGKILLNVKDTQNKDHPQFMDKQYRKRRDYIASIALQYNTNQPIPDIQYTNEEIHLWRKIYEKLRALHSKGMCKRYQIQMQRLQKEFLLSKRIPQLNQLSQYLKSQTGFTIKPTHGILSQRQFFQSFAFRVFCCTQYLRNTSTPDYTPQPDIVHEIIGHIPLLADPQIASLSQQIGLLILGATDEQVTQLGSLYWFTLQFGACLEGDKKLGYGAGIASSISEIQHLMSGKAKFTNFQPFIDCHATYPIQTVQENYRVTESFEKAIADLQIYGQHLNKPVHTTYNFQTKSIEFARNVQGIDFGEKPLNFV